MNWDFFTFGGSLFWEDVFFYQKWRIQRHCLTKTYRLLDSWDIRRASGSFDDCKNAFIKYISSYEITKQTGKMIILLHGFMDSKNIFKHLWRKFVLLDSTVAALNYPSLFKSSRESAYQLLFFLNHVDDISEVSFVTKGIGNLVLQKALNAPASHQLFRNQMRIGNIVEINPLSTRCVLCDFLSQFKFFRILCGPTLKDMTTTQLKYIPNLPPQLNSLKIYSDSKLFRLCFHILTWLHIPVDDIRSKARNAIFIKGTTFYTLRNEEILNKTVNFIKNGKI